jgi:hypothetical protein
METSCAEFMVLQRIPLGDDRLQPIRSTDGIFQLDTCALDDGLYGFFESCVKALHRGQIHD